MWRACVYIPSADFYCRRAATLRHRRAAGALPSVSFRFRSVLAKISHAAATPECSKAASAAYAVGAIGDARAHHHKDRAFLHSTPVYLSLLIYAHLTPDYLFARHLTLIT